MKINNFKTAEIGDFARAKDTDTYGTGIKVIADVFLNLENKMMYALNNCGAFESTEFDIIEPDFPSYSFVRVKKSGKVQKVVVVSMNGDHFGYILDDYTRMYDETELEHVTEVFCNHDASEYVISVQLNDYKIQPNIPHFVGIVTEVVEAGVNVDFLINYQITCCPAFSLDVIFVEKREKENPQYYNGKVVCIRETPDCTKGRIYEIKDGVMIDDVGDARPQTGDPAYKAQTFDDFKRSMMGNFAEVEEIRKPKEEDEGWNGQFFVLKSNSKYLKQGVVYTVVDGFMYDEEDVKTPYFDMNKWKSFDDVKNFIGTDAEILEIIE